MSRCAACGRPLAPSTGPPRKWCSDRCRKSQYAQHCVDCGAPTSGSEGRRAEPRCRTCGNRRAGDAKRIWTHERAIERIREWAAIYGDPPAQPDWNPYGARVELGDPARAERFEAAAGYWPSFNVVVQLFGSWNDGIAAAGFEPRAPFGTSASVRRKRRYRSQPKPEALAAGGSSA